MEGRRPVQGGGKTLAAGPELVLIARSWCAVGSPGAHTAAPRGQPEAQAPPSLRRCGSHGRSPTPFLLSARLSRPFHFLPALPLPGSRPSRSRAHGAFADPWRTPPPESGHARGSEGDAGECLGRGAPRARWAGRQAPRASRRVAAARALQTDLVSRGFRGRRAHLTVALPVAGPTGVGWREGGPTAWRRVRWSL